MLVRFALDLYLSVFICVHLWFHRFFFSPLQETLDPRFTRPAGSDRMQSLLCCALSQQVSLMVRRGLLGSADCLLVCPSISSSFRWSCTGVNWVMGAAGGRKSRKTASNQSRAYGTGRRLARRSHCAWKIRIGQIGRRRCPWRISPALKKPAAR